MPEMRKDPITKSWTIIATERAKRPDATLVKALIEEPEIEHDENCFFCYGNEHTTPDEVLAYREVGMPNTPDWSLRVVPNKFAALTLEEDFRLIHDNSTKVYSPATGVSEVLIESPHHSKNIALFSQEKIAEIIKAYKERYIAISKIESIKYIQIFRNNGFEAGASISHPHSQIMATPIIPVNIVKELDGAREFFEATGKCVFCEMIASELNDKSRIIYENQDFISFVPYAAKSPFETWVIPKFHSSEFNKITEKQTYSLAEVWQATLYKLYKGLANPPYNYFIHTSPTRKNVEKLYHWHIEMIPKTTVAAGFELGTGMNINISVPEDCAAYLREISHD